MLPFVICVDQTDTGEGALRLLVSVGALCRLLFKILILLILFIYALLLFILSSNLPFPISFMTYIFCVICVV